MREKATWCLKITVGTYSFVGRQTCWQANFQAHLKTQIPKTCLTAPTLPNIYRVCKFSWSNDRVLSSALLNLYNIVHFESSLKKLHHIPTYVKLMIFCLLIWLASGLLPSRFPVVPRHWYIGDFCITSALEVSTSTSGSPWVIWVGKDLKSCLAQPLAGVQGKVSVTSIQVPQDFSWSGLENIQGSKLWVTWSIMSLCLW